MTLETFLRLTNLLKFKALYCRLCANTDRLDTIEGADTALEERVTVVEDSFIVEASAEPTTGTDLTGFPGGVAPASGLGFYRDVAGSVDYWFADGVWRTVATTAV